MYEGLKIANMYTLSETIAEELLSSVTYPWEVLPKIGEFIKKLGPTLSYGLQRMRLFSRLLISMDRLSSVKEQKSDIVHLSEAMPL